MTIKQLFLTVLTFVAIALVSFALYNSWSQPQFQSRLELYQTDLLLQATEWRGENYDGPDLSPIRNTLVGSQPLETVSKLYQNARNTATTNLENLRSQQELQGSADRDQLSVRVQNLENQIQQLDLRFGILQTQRSKTEAALKTWNPLTETSETATILVGLWSEPPIPLPDAESRINNELTGWFRYRVLSRLYELQQRPDALEKLDAAEQEMAQQVFFKLFLASGIQTLGGFLGTGLLIFIIVQWLLKGKESLWAQNRDVSWSTPWDWETILQVLIVGFFFVGQIVPQVLRSLVIDRQPAGVRGEALYILASYLLLAISGLLVLYVSVKPFFPLPKDWFRINWRDNWLVWGFGGFLAALPIVIVVSLINQQLWQGQGGSNPILPIALSGNDPVAIAIFAFTGAVAAPIFEEIVFRGFLLASLTRYLPIWGAIVASSFLFAVVHISLSELLPLMTLGMVMGFVYTRSRNLLAPILLHSLWNGSTLLSLFLLGSAAN